MSSPADNGLMTKISGPARREQSPCYHNSPRRAGFLKPVLRSPDHVEESIPTEAVHVVAVGIQK